MKVSVITPTYNQRALLEKAAASVADQLPADELEHLVQEGDVSQQPYQIGSGAGNVTVVVEEDSGMYNAINKGFAKASGEIISWLNSDEQYLEGTLAKVVQWFHENPGKDILFGDVVTLDTEGIPMVYRKALLPHRGYITSNFLPTFSAATFVRSSVFNGGLHLDESYKTIADAVWIVEMLKRGHQAGVLNEPLSTFEVSEENLGQSALAKQEIDDWGREQTGSLFPLRKLGWKCIYRIRKLLNGSYGSHEVEIAFYKDSSRSRRRWKGTLGGKWRDANHGT